MSRVRENQQGFTLVELMIVVVLLLIVFGAATHFLLDILGYSNKSIQTGNAQHMAAESLDRIGNDLRSSISPDRSEGGVAKREQLKTWMLWGTPTTGLDMRDIALATPTELWFRANVVPEATGVVPATECVGYSFDSNRRFVRSVYANWRTCPGTGTPTERLILIPAISQAEAAVNGEYFTYRLAHNTNPNVQPLSPNDCNYETVASPSVAQTNYIVGVNIDLRSLFSNGAAYGESKVRGAIDLRMRLTRDYQYALGCAY